MVFVVLALIACGGTLPWKAPGAPQAPPDEQFGTGVEAGENVYIWHCHNGSRIVLTQAGSCFGTREPVIARGVCGAPLPDEQRLHEQKSRTLSDSFKWPEGDAGM